MKIYSYLTILLLFLTVTLSAQKRSGSINLNTLNKKQNKVIQAKQLLPDRNMMVLKKSGSNKSLLENIDTLNYPLEGEYAVYTYVGGYVSGTNAWGDKAKVNLFEHDQPSVLKGVLIDFAIATSSNANVEIAAWDNSGAQNSPGNKIASVNVSLDDIFIDVLNDHTTYIPFDNPVAMTSTFYLGVVLPTTSDTLALYTNTDGDTNPGTAWELWSDNQWFPYYDTLSWGLNMAHAIFPIVDSDVGLIANFFGSATAINPGTPIDFFDTSVGGPTSWSWTFEGGNPGVSTEESPTVLYSSEGLYDVRLIVGNGETFDTLVRQDYILVAEEIPIESDTLIYPLPGTKTIYEIIDNQGLHGGYVCGNNLYNDLIKANYYSINEDIKITGILVDFVVAKGSNQDIEIAIWNNNGNSGEPGTKLASRMIELNTIKSDVANNALSYVSFDPPISLGHPFYAGFRLPTAAGDTIAAWSNEDGNTFPGIAWDKWESGIWVPLSDPNSWSLNIAMGIHPIVEYQTGLNEVQIAKNLPVYPNPSKGKISIDLSDFTTEMRVELIDMTGNVMVSEVVSPSTSSFEMDLSHQYTGIYFVRVVSSTLIGVQKVIRN